MKGESSTVGWLGFPGPVTSLVKEVGGCLWTSAEGLQ
jgi:hypothetical protein